MVAVVVNEGKKVGNDMIFAGSNPDHQTSLQLGLFTNASGLSAASVYADITEPTLTNGYARKTITGASWTINTAGDCTRVDEVFTASGGSFSAPVYGWFLAFVGGATNRLLAYEIDPSGPRTLLDGYTYTVEFSSGNTFNFGKSVFPCDEAEEMIAHLVLRGTHADRGTALTLRLYTNSGVLDNTVVAANLVVPTDGSYADAPIVNATWSIDAAGRATYPQQSFMPDGGSWNENVHGFALVTVGGTAERIMLLHEDANAPITSDYNVDLDIAA